MANVLILLTLPEPIRNQYRDRLRNRFPGITIELVDHHSKVGPYIGKADALITFAPMLSSEVLAAATRLKWVQALGTGVDNLIDPGPAPGRDRHQYARYPRRSGFGSGTRRHAGTGTG